MDMNEFKDALPLAAKNVQGGILLANRIDALNLLPKGGTFVEVGVALGDLTKAVLDVCEVQEFIAIDMFDMERWPHTWNGRVGRELGSRTHFEYYKEKFSKEIATGKMQLLAGDSVSMLSQLPDRSADVIYLDSDHSYEHVRDELKVANQKIKDDGVIVLNDYVMFDAFRNVPYGVVQAGNEFILNEGWHVLYFAMHHQMFCDLAIKRLR